MNSLETHHQNKELCPYFGLRHDRRTAMNYPSPQNFCHNVPPPAIPGVDYQSQFCLTAACTTCKLYVGNSRKRMPANIASAEGGNLQKRRKLIWIPLVITLLLMVALAAWKIFSPNLIIKPVAQQPVVLDNATKMVATETQLASPLPEATVISAPTKVQSVTITSTPTKSSTPTTTYTITLTPTPTRVLPLGHLLEVPFGRGQKYLLHQVVDPETIELLAERYMTSVDVIIRANNNLILPLTAGTVSIIPLNQTDVSAIIPLSAFRISTIGVTLQTFAQENGLNLDVLSALNDLAPEYQLQPGEWVIAPYYP